MYKKPSPRVQKTEMGSLKNVTLAPSNVFWSMTEILENGYLKHFSYKIGEIIDI